MNIKNEDQKSNQIVDGGGRRRVQVTGTSGSCNHVFVERGTLDTVDFAFMTLLVATMLESLVANGALELWLDAALIAQVP